MNEKNYTIPPMSLEQLRQFSRAFKPVRVINTLKDCAPDEMIDAIIDSGLIYDDNFLDDFLGKRSCEVNYG